MKQLLTLVCGFMCLCLSAQELIISKEQPGEQGWPLLWDIEHDGGDDLYVSSEQGIIYVKTNDEWKAIEVVESDIRSMSFNREEGKLWFGSKEGIFSLKDLALVDNINSSNGLPEGEVRKIVNDGSVVYASLNNNGFVRIKGEEIKHFTKSNSQLKYNGVDDMEILDDGSLMLITDEYVYLINGEEWKITDLDDAFGFQTWAQDLYLDHKQDVWISTRNGLLKFNSSDKKFESYQNEYGKVNYSKVIFTPKNELWLAEYQKGLTYISPEGEQYVFSAADTDAPSQVFDFEYFKEEVKLVGNFNSVVGTLKLNLEPNSVIDTYSESIVLYPNPSSGLVSLSKELNDEYKIKVFNLLGVQIMNLEWNEKINLEEQPAGIYYVELYNEVSNSGSVKKVVLH